MWHKKGQDRRISWLMDMFLHWGEVKDGEVINPPYLSFFPSFVRKIKPRNLRFYYKVNSYQKIVLLQYASTILFKTNYQHATSHSYRNWNSYRDENDENGQACIHSDPHYYTKNNVNCADVWIWTDTDLDIFWRIKKIYTIWHSEADKDIN